MARKEKRLGKPVPPPSTRALKRQLSYSEQMTAAKEALEAALGEDDYEKVFPGSIRVDGDNVTAKMDLGPAGHKMISISISQKKVLWSKS